MLIEITQDGSPEQQQRRQEWLDGRLLSGCTIRTFREHWTLPWSAAYRAEYVVRDRLAQRLPEGYEDVWLSGCVDWLL